MIDKIIDPSKLWELIIDNIKTDKVDMFLSLFKNLRSLKLLDLKVQLDYKILFSQMRALTSLEVGFERSLATLEALN